MNVLTLKEAARRDGVSLRHLQRLIAAAKARPPSISVPGASESLSGTTSAG